MNRSFPDKPRVLLVDDDSLVLHCLFRFLSRRFSVFKASDHEEAERLLGRHEVDVVVSDFDMPGKDGSEVLRTARRLQPVALRVMHSSLGPPDLEDQLSEGLVHHFLPKYGRATLEELVRLIEALATPLPLAS